MAKFSIDLEDKPFLKRLSQENKAAFSDIVKTFVGLMEVAAEKNWHELPQHIHSSLSFSDVVNGVLNAVMTTKEIDKNVFATLEYDLHPLALLSDKREDMVTGERMYTDWRSYFSIDSKDVSRETIEQIIRKMMYLVRWFDIDTVSRALMSSDFPIRDPKDIAKLPFQPALKYQAEQLGDLYVGKFFHEIGAFNCGTIEPEAIICPACHIGDFPD